MTAYGPANPADEGLPYNPGQLDAMTPEWLRSEIRMLHVQLATQRRELAENVQAHTRWRALAVGLAAVVRGQPKRPVVRKAWSQAAPALAWAENARTWTDLPGWAPEPAWPVERTESEARP